MEKLFEEWTEYAVEKKLQNRERIAELSYLFFFNWR